MAADGTRRIVRSAQPDRLTASDRKKARSPWKVADVRARRWLTERRAFRLFYVIAVSAVWLALIARSY